ncbi:MAG TPA: M23 family metallopeptidase [Acidimicrobiales bacterium]|nr:M23 family metallopeptidase [Acidimicrobiales bacterium]
MESTVRRRGGGLLLVMMLGTAGCSSAPLTHAGTPATTARSSTSTTAVSAPTTTTTLPRPVSEQPWTPFATVGGLALRHPAFRVERVAFHESNHDGAQPMLPTATAIRPTVLESRERDTPANTAVDIVVDPATEIRAPVSGVVKRSGGYTLYCDNRDEYAVIQPDGQPEWEVKVLHMSGVRVERDQRVEAGVTVIASRANRLPFASQVEEVSARPPWPHVHIEVVDPRIPDRPSPSNCN